MKALQAGAGNYRWVAAVSGSQSAASLELASGGEPVMAIGGFNNEGGNLSLAQFKQYVARGEIHYYIAGESGGAGPAANRSGAMAGRSGFTPPAGGGRPGGFGGQGGSSSSAITTWVKAHYKSQTVGGETVYNLTAKAST